MTIFTREHAVFPEWAALVSTLNGDWHTYEDAAYDTAVSQGQVLEILRSLSDVELTWQEEKVYNDRMGTWIIAMQEAEKEMAEGTPAQQEERFQARISRHEIARKPACDLTREERLSLVRLISIYEDRDDTIAFYRCVKNTRDAEIALMDAVIAAVPLDLLATVEKLEIFRDYIRLMRRTYEEAEEQAIIAADVIAVV